MKIRINNGTQSWAFQKLIFLKTIREKGKDNNLLRNKY